MFASQVKPAYWVVHTQPGQEPATTRFINLDLLTARRSALTLFEHLFRASTFDLETTIELLLVEEQSVSKGVTKMVMPSIGLPDYKLIALVLKRAVYIGKNGAVAGLEGQDLIPYDEIAGQQAACLTKLKGLNDEGYYYLRQGHRAGFGYLDLTVHLENQVKPVAIGYVLLDSLGLIHAIAGGYNSSIDSGRGYECKLSYSTAYYGEHDAQAVVAPTNQPSR